LREGVHFLQAAEEHLNYPSDALGSAKRVVVKVGTQVLSHSDSQLDLNILRDLCEQASALREQGHEVILVTSGAVAAGRSRLGLDRADKSLPTQQACAAVGQAILMEHYNAFFSRLSRSTAQILLTQEDFADSERFGNLLRTFQYLLAHGVIPIVNENDTLSIHELDRSEGRGTPLFGDNDVLSSLIAVGVKADILCILSNVDGLLNHEGMVLQAVSSQRADLAGLDHGQANGRGGLQTKLQAFRHASANGIPGILANGKTPRILVRICTGELLGTYFAAAPISQMDGQYASVLAHQAKKAATALSKITIQERELALVAMAEELEAHAQEILEQNRQDVEKGKEANLSAALLARLRLSESGVLGLCDTLRSVAALKDKPDTLSSWTLENGLKISQVRTALGAILLIFESRPDVAVEAGALAIKSGNSIVLKGGREAARTNAIIAKLLQAGAARSGLPSHSVQIFEKGRDELSALLAYDDCFELVVARGGEGLIQLVRKNSKIPVLCAGGGNCHLYIHGDADIPMALSIALNAKVQKPSACNAIEKVLVHSSIAPKLLPLLEKEMTEHQVQLRGCPRSIAILGGQGIKAAEESDWKTEYLDLILAVKVVDSVDEAIGHINAYGTRHSEAIVCKDAAAAVQFARDVDAAVVYHNASTRFSDGAQFGFGAEVCISTQKLHARGPVGADGLSTYKYLVDGEGQIRR
jgi:delta-1-pyrroline-5-carboxylate synthetase